MWNDPSPQIHPVRFLRGVAAPRVVVGEFALNKVIAQLRYGHWETTSLQRIWANFSQQSRVLPNCDDYSLAVDAFSMRSSVGPAELPNIWTTLPTTPD